MNGRCVWLGMFLYCFLENVVCIWMVPLWYWGVVWGVVYMFSWRLPCNGADTHLPMSLFMVLVKLRLGQFLHGFGHGVGIMLEGLWHGLAKYFS